MALRSFTLRVSEEQVRVWGSAAKRDERGLSDWVRRTLDRAASGVVELVDTRPMPAPSSEGSDRGRGGKLMANSPSNAGSSPAPATKKVKACLHGKEKGYHCWQCGGMAKVEA